jgi:DNA polymerase-3 subunit epsilon
MTWWSRLRARYHALDALTLSDARFVVVDTETSGLDTERAELLSIGAVVIEGLRIDLAQQFECVLRADTELRTENVLIHGIGPGTLAEGSPPSQALAEFLAFVDDSPLVAFHAPFDRRILQRAVQKHLGQRLRHRFLDLAQLAPTLLPERAPEQGASLDAWLAQCQLQVEERHNAAADAMATAELLLIVLHRARAQGVETVGELDRRVAVSRRLQAMRGPR